ncbi:transcriptional regulator ArgR [Niveibacterium umoris]|uniref:Transcriptional regulator GlxA family with amidase domain n=1 Tax=Niveibacterium umoris TaxID=1193620 RepID=A0A840BBN5_9RHOO|nr:GlxA family transcriptional regulator [Niveibacterium umoris]MBB4010951.1 transcriptional regulator GlxA family with amidase domain [Niveibacterium umoris]
MTTPQRYGFLLLPGFPMFALAGALEVLGAANGLLGEQGYAPYLLSLDGASVAAGGGARVEVNAGFAEATELHAVFVVSDHSLGALDLGACCQWLAARGDAGCLIGGIGTGAAVLADAGLLRGHRATVHWPHVAEVAERHAETVVSSNLYEIDRGRLTCAGGTASVDMLLAWMGVRHGERVAQEIAAQLGLERIRARDERQLVPSAARIGGGSAKLAEALALMEANLSEPLPTEDIARLVGVSRRQLERLFKQHLDALPSRYYLDLRLTRARRLLQQSSQSILQIGLACGFASGPHFSNAYRSHFGRTPREERSQRAAAWRDVAPVREESP